MGMPKVRFGREESRHRWEGDKRTADKGVGKKSSHQNVQENTCFQMVCGNLVMDSLGCFGSRGPLPPRVGLLRSDALSRREDQLLRDMTEQASRNKTTSRGRGLEVGGWGTWWLPAIRFLSFLAF